MTLQPRRARLRTQWGTILWLAAVWVLLWGDLSVANVLAGLALGLAVTYGLRMTPIEFHGRVRPLRVVHLFARFGVDLVRASFEVAFIALRGETQGVLDMLRRERLAAAPAQRRLADEGIGRAIEQLVILDEDAFEFRLEGLRDFHGGQQRQGVRLR